jgi:hypothetical protein
MQFDISIDLGPLANVFTAAFGGKEDNSGALLEALKDTMDASSRQLVLLWSKEATIALSSNGAAGYIRYLTEDGAIYPFEGDPLHIIVENKHPAAYYLEMGTNAFDMKKMLGSSAKVKTTKDGDRYIRIPLEHSRKALDTFNIGQKASGLAATRNIPHGGGPRRTEWGDRMIAGNLGRRSKIVPVQGDLAQSTAQRIGTSTTLNKAGIPGRLAQYTWKASPFQSLVRFQDNKGKTSSFKTFRTISDNSDPDSWMHPGIAASHIAEKASIEMTPIFIQAVGEVTKKAFEKLGI